MPTHAIPPILRPYLSSFQKLSLYLVTSVLGASSNWLLLRFLSAATSLHPQDASEDGNNPPYGVIFLSFLRDYNFWRENARKIGIDITKLASQDRFICIDGLSELFGANSQAGGASSTSPAVRGDHVILRDPRLQKVEEAVLELVSRMDGAATSRGSSATAGPSDPASGGRTLLIVDGLDFLMAATEEADERVVDMIMSWRKRVHSMVVTMSADSPLIHNPSTSLETNHLRLAVTLAHQSKIIMGLRLLDTGTAKDVSGVLRISRGPEADDSDEEREVLYFVGGDGNVKIFERGAQ